MPQTPGTTADAPPSAGTRPCQCAALRLFTCILLRVAACLPFLSCVGKSPPGFTRKKAPGRPGRADCEPSASGCVRTLRGSVQSQPAPALGAGGWGLGAGSWVGRSAGRPRGPPPSALWGGGEEPRGQATTRQRTQRASVSLPSETEIAPESLPRGGQAPCPQGAGCRRPAGRARLGLAKSPRPGGRPASLFSHPRHLLRACPSCDTAPLAAVQTPAPGAQGALSRRPL